MRSGNSYFLNSPMLAAANRVSGSEARVKYLLVTGGVCSSLGKGVTTSSIGCLLRQSGFRVAAIKIDPYINIDAGLMSPFEHGEVFVLQDGGEVDLDLGNYERWMRVKLTRSHNITTGKVYETLISKERRGEFLGKTVQVIPHLTDEVIRRVQTCAATPVDGSGLRPQICLIELGGTIGDIESAPFVEALRQLRFSLPPEDFCLAHVTYLPTMGESQKTKPTQHSCRTLLSLGMSPDFLICRLEHSLQADARRKISSLVGLQEKYIFDAHNCGSLYEVPVLFHAQDMVAKIVHKMGITVTSDLPPAMGVPSIEELVAFAKVCKETTRTIRIAFVGKYCDGGSDTYFSVMQAFEHASITVGVKISFLWVESELLEAPTPAAAQLREQLSSVDGIFVAGGFGTRGIEGKVVAANIAREKKIPYLGVCLGMQIALMEYGRNVLHLDHATSEEFDGRLSGEPPKSQHHVVMFMPEIDRTTMGANMRLGERCVFVADAESHLKSIYGGATQIAERHRHRYEFNMKYYKQYADSGLKFVGSDDPNFGPETRVEGIELPVKDHPFFLAVQYHPEFQTWVNDPSPPYAAFVAAAAKLPNKLPTSFNSRRAD